MSFHQGFSQKVQWNVLGISLGFLNPLRIISGLKPKWLGNSVFYILGLQRALQTILMCWCIRDTAVLSPEEKKRKSYTIYVTRKFLVIVNVWNNPEAAHFILGRPTCLFIHLYCDILFEKKMTKKSFPWFHYFIIICTMPLGLHIFQFCICHHGTGIDKKNSCQQIIYPLNHVWGN